MDDVAAMVLCGTFGTRAGKCQRRGKNRVCNGSDSSRAYAVFFCYMIHRSWITFFCLFSIHDSKPQSHLFDLWAENRHEGRRRESWQSRAVWRAHNTPPRRQRCKIQSGQTNPSVLRSSFVCTSLFKSFCLIFSMAAVPCGPPFVELSAGDRAIVSSSFWSLDLKTATHAAAGCRDVINVIEASGSNLSMFMFTFQILQRNLCNINIHLEMSNDEG